MRVQVDKERCYGSGECELLSPEGFRVGDDGVAVVLDPARGLDPQTLELVRNSCPSQAISLSDDG